MRPSAHNRVSNETAPNPFRSFPALLCGSRSRSFARARRGDLEKRLAISQRTTADRPTTGFDSFDLCSELRQAVADAGYTDPRPIQEEALPAALDGCDVLGLAQTGTGKTAAFVLPILQRLLGKRGPGPRALVVAPTRELAAQVHSEFERLGVHTPLTSMVVFGGVPVARHIRALRSTPDVIVACPGRLLDLMNQGAVHLDKVEVLVLDEADHMFDMGFLPDIRRILKALPARRQNLLFSATMPREIRKLADNVLRRPTVVELGNSRPAETIDHALYSISEGDKDGALEKLLSSDDFRSAIVFLRTKHRAKRLAQRLEKRGHAAVALQGNMSQPQRERALKGFREGRFEVLVATDIAARGLDIAGVSHVVNFDVPNTPDAYTHRIGRTGRSEQTGNAFTFVTSADSAAVRAIERRLGSSIERRRISDGTGKSQSRRNRRPASEEQSSRNERPGRDERPARNSRSARNAQPARTEQPASSERRQPEHRAPAPVVARPVFGLGVVDAGA